MPKAAALSSLAEPIGPAASNVETMPAPDSNQENMAPEKKGKGRAKATAARKTKPASKRLSGGKVKKVTKNGTGTKRAPLKEQANEQEHSDTEEVDEFPEEIQATQGSVPEPLEDEASVSTKKPPLKKGKTGRPTSKKNAIEQVKVLEKDGEFEYTPTAARQTAPDTKITAAKRGAARKPKIPTDKTIQASQTIPMDLDESSVPDAETEEQVPQSVYRQARQAQATPRQPRASNPTARRGAGNASDTERGSDPVLRRKLGEMTKKFENLDIKYENLRDVGITEAQANFDRLKKQSELQAKVADDLISSLRTELVTAKTHASEAKSLRTTVSSAQASCTAAEECVANLSKTLVEAQNENKALQARLAASRAAPTTMELTSGYGNGNKPPGSAMKGKAPAMRALVAGSAESAAAAQVAQLKEDLYSDLTGLILRGVDRQGAADVYDCIQTGRNGTLHFHLCIASDITNETSYENTEFTYTPHLDDDRDRELLEILPDYLTEEITFSRSHAASFYFRVCDTLTRKLTE